MSRTLKLVVYAAIIEMILVALAVFAWEGGAFPWLPAPRPIAPRSQFILVFAPAWYAIGAAYAARRLASNRPRISDDHRRFLEGSLKGCAAVVVAMQGLFAYDDVTGATMDRALVGRGLIVFLGIWMTIHGNAIAKLDPPSGDGAPAHSVWTRTSLRSGWIMVGLGLGLVFCALTLPDLRMVWTVMVAITAICVALELQYRRMTRPGDSVAMNLSEGQS